MQSQHNVEYNLRNEVISNADLLLYLTGGKLVFVPQ